MTDQPYKPKVNDKVILDPAIAGKHAGRVWIVEKLNPINHVLRPADGQGRGLRCPGHYLQPFTGEETATPFGRPYEPTVFFDTGDIVTAKVANREVTTETPLVVFKDDGGDKVNVTLLGGNNGRYWRWPRGGLVKRDLEWLKGAL